MDGTGAQANSGSSTASAGDSPRDEAWMPRLQVESRRLGPVERVVAIVQGLNRGAHASLLAYDTERSTWGAWFGPVEPRPFRHDIDVVLSGIEPAPATYWHLTQFGILGIARGLDADLRAALDAPIQGDRGATEILSGLTRMVTARAFARDFRLDPARFGYPSPSAQTRPPASDPAPRVLPPAPPPRVVRLVRLRPELGAIAAGPPSSPRVPSEDLAAAGAALDAAVAPLLVAHRPEISALLGAGNWTASAYAALAESGDAGERRRQAVQIYPGLAPLIVSCAAVREAVDTGRPFEAVLRDALADTLHEPQRAGLTLAGLRRLRSLHVGAKFDDVVRAADITARVPVDRLPLDSDGWRRAITAMARLATALDGMGLDLAVLLDRSAGGWTDVEVLAGTELDPSDDSGSPFLRLRRMRQTPMDEALDMANQLTTSLVGPLRTAMALPPDPNGDRRVAGRILFAGRSGHAITRLQARWHRAHDAFQAALPCGGTTNAWPEAFPPFTAANGLVIRCLLDEAALKREGSPRPDAEGNPGLAHCVGGYGPNCYGGQCQVASVRRLVDGREERVSTVELRPHEKGGRFELRVHQHRGPANADPAAEAHLAVAELERALREGRHPYDAFVIRPRSPHGYVLGYDPAVPGNLETAYAAWTPFLPRPVAREGLDGIRRRIAGEGLDPSLQEALTPPSD